MSGRHGIPSRWPLFIALFALLAPPAAVFAGSSWEARPSTGPTPVLTADGSWRGRGPARNGWGPSGIYDALRQRMVIFGGQAGPIVANSSDIVWELSLDGTPSWTALTTSGSGPLGRQSHSAIYDPVRDRMILFGGQGAAVFGDVWAFSLGTHTWSQLSPAGPAPAPRQGHTAIYDPVRDRMIVFGGNDASTIDRNDVWALSLGATPTWTPLTPTGAPPPVRGWHTAIYDPVRDRMVIFAGWVWATSSSIGDTWSLNLSGTPSWTPLTASGTPAVRNSHSAIYDPIGDRMVVFGGYVSDLTVLSFSGSPAWSTLVPAGTGPSLRDGTAGVYDAPRQRMVLFGGIVENLGSVWAATLGGSPAWEKIAAVGTPEANGGLVVRDTRRDRLVFLAAAGYAGEVWTRNLVGEPTWAQIAVSGTPPYASQASAIYDPVRDRVVLYGGAYTDETWALSLETNTWTKIEPPGTLPAIRFAHTAIYDPARDRMVVYGGGWGDWNDFHEEIWALPLGGGAWYPLTPAGPEPIGRDGHTAIYDPVGDRMVVCGGHDGFGSFRRDVWSFDLDTHVWNEILPSPALPHDVVWMTSVYDAQRDRMLLFGGTDFVHGGSSNELWSLSFSGGPAWTLLTPSGPPPLGRQQHGAIYDGLRDCMVVYGGGFTDTWEYSPAATTAVPDAVPPAGTALTFATPSPNPAQARSVLAFSLARSGRATLDVFDASGRRVRRLVDAWLPAGPQRAEWTGEDDRGRRVATGLYFARLQCGGEEARQRIVRLE